MKFFFSYIQYCEMFLWCTKNSEFTTSEFFQVLKGNDFEMYLKAFKAWETVCPYSTQEV